MVSLNYGDYFKEFRPIWLNKKLSLYHFALKYLPGIDYATVVYEFKAVKASLQLRARMCLMYRHSQKRIGLSSKEKLALDV